MTEFLTWLHGASVWSDVWKMAFMTIILVGAFGLARDFFK